MFPHQLFLSFDPSKYFGSFFKGSTQENNSPSTEQCKVEDPYEHLHSEIWKYTGEEEDQEAGTGKTYNYKVKKYFDPNEIPGGYEEVSRRVEQANERVFPAVECGPEDVLIRFGEENVIKSFYIKSKVREITKELLIIRDNNLKNGINPIVNQLHEKHIQLIIGENLTKNLISLKKIDTDMQKEDFIKKFNLFISELTKYIETVELHKQTITHLQKVGKVLRDSGFRADIDETGSITLALPDETALLARWENIRKKIKHLPELRITTNEVNDNSDSKFMDFFWDNLNKGRTTTLRKYKVHDDGIHIASMIEQIFCIKIPENRAKAFEEEVQRIDNIMRPAGNKIKAAREHLKTQGPENLPYSSEELKMLELTLSAAMDKFSVASDYSLKNAIRYFYETEKNSHDVFKFTWTPNFLRLWEAVFPKEELNIQSLREIWTKVDQAIQI